MSCLDWSPSPEAPATPSANGLGSRAYRNCALALVLVAPLFALHLRAQENTGNSAPLGFAPFGFRCGMTPEQVDGSAGKGTAKESPGGLVQLTTAPYPDPVFHSYSLVLAPKRGVVMINALGFNPGAAQEAGLRAAFTSVRDQLSKIYGAPAQDLDLAGNATFWVLGEQNAAPDPGPRHWAAVWNLSPPLKEHIQGIVLDAEQASGYFFLSYECAGIESVPEQVKTAALSQSAVPMAFLPRTSPHIEDAPRAVTVGHQVRYEVTANYYGVKVPVDVAYLDAAGATVKVHAQVPWSFTFTSQPGQSLSLSASNPIDYGYIRCAIYLDGALLRSDSDWGVGTVEVKANATPAKAVTHAEPSR